MFKQFMQAVLFASAALGIASSVTVQAADFSGHRTAVVFYSLLHNRIGGDDFAAEHPVGHTEHIADLIAAATGGTKISLVQAQPYANDYDEVVDQARSEQDANARPELKAVPDLSGYDIVFVGYPCWWGSYPMAFATLFDTGALNGKVVIPFTTHEGSRFGHSLTDLRSALPQSTILEGYACRGGDALDEDTAAEVQEFLQGLDLPN